MPELPFPPDLDQLRRQARELLRAAAQGEPDALARLHAVSDRVVLSAAQMSAVLVNGTIPESSTLTNRLWGGLTVLGGIVELAGAGLLCFAPEPTLASKAGCVLFGLHGADTLGTGARQVWTGLEVSSITGSGTARIATSFGASPRSATLIGSTVDIAVPMFVGAWFAAVRVASVRAGAISLLQHEALTGSRAGGHTIFKHIGKTEAQLAARLAAERSLNVASSFTSLALAERVISAALRADRARVLHWARGAARAQAPLAVVHRAGTNVGVCLVRGTARAIPTQKLRVVLLLQAYNGMPYYVLTAYPIP